MNLYGATILYKTHCGINPKKKPQIFKSYEALRSDKFLIKYSEGPSSIHFSKGHWYNVDLYNQELGESIGLEELSMKCKNEPGR